MVDAKDNAFRFLTIPVILAVLTDKATRCSEGFMCHEAGSKKVTGFSGKYVKIPKNSYATWR